MFKSRKTSLLLLFILGITMVPSFAYAQLAFPQDLGGFDFRTITAEAAVVMDQKTGKVIVAHNDSVVWRPASLTKLVTALVVLDANPNLKGSIVMKKEDEVGGGRLATKTGISYSVVDMMHAALIASANNATGALARSTGFSKKVFVQKMNEKAIALGATNTRFVETTGISVDNYTTALDFTKLAQAAFNDPRIVNIAQKKVYAFSALNNKKYRHTIRTTNQLLTDGGVIVTGGKTGYIDESRYNFVGALKDIFGKDVIVTVLGSANRQAEFNEAKQLATWAWLNHPWPQVAGAVSQ